MLFALVFGLRPRRCLEIGTHQGGSALITVEAFDAIGAGTLLCIDDYPRISPENWARMKHRVTLMAGKSQDILPTIASLGPFDFAFVDGDHSTGRVVEDLEAILPMIADGAYILCHDAHNASVKNAITYVVSCHPELIDCGILTTEQIMDGEDRWGGMQLLRRGHGAS